MEKKGKRLPGTGHYKGEYGVGDRWFSELEACEKNLTERLKLMRNVLVLGSSPDEKVPPENSLAFYGLVREPKEIHIFTHTNHAYEGVENEALSIMNRWFKIHMS